MAMPSDNLFLTLSLHPHVEGVFSQETFTITAPTETAITSSPSAPYTATSKYITLSTPASASTARLVTSLKTALLSAGTYTVLVDLTGPGAPDFGIPDFSPRYTSNISTFTALNLSTASFSPSFSPSFSTSFSASASASASA
eukprot:CAMPEP_0173292616 /NCGR_PEP_ID=MMETSP1143-20121109/12833_1 /TAXON_ID=483371 /ORGANISM="non described non described, Strain CCMP2298" /LENGTH=141 /DNA_ID=CAMNT_0014232035 /DNA_START=26 /DNA_END=447 /DNA_ORIENTATION=-